MNTNGVTIVSTDKELKEFIEFAYSHYSASENWIPPLRHDQKKLLNTKKNPYFNNAEMALFIAEHNGKPAGRISAVVDHRFNEYHGRKTGHFGFFECIDNQDTANLLFKAACDWLKDKGMEDVLGPASPGMMDTIGLLVDSFDKDPFIMMAYNKNYYEKLILNAGFEPEIDLLAFMIHKKDVDMDRVDRAMQIVKKRLPDLTFRPINLKKINTEVEIVRKIYNEAWKNNWGFLPLTKEELAATAKEFKMILDPGFAHIAEIKGEPVAFSVALPDFNQILKNLNGNLLPFGFIKIMLGKKKITQVRTALMGVIPEYQGKGIDALLHQRSIDYGSKNNVLTSELSWVLGNNIEMIRVAERLGGKLDKTYRMFKKKL